MAELYNEGLFRKGLVRTSGLVRPDLLLTFDDIFSPYAIDRLEAALALDFNNNVYRTGNKYTTFADAFTGTSPKLTYSTAAGSNSTMVNSEGKLVWAPHNLVDYSDDLTGAAVAYSSLNIDSADTFTFTNNNSHILLAGLSAVATKGKYTARAYISGNTPGDTFSFELVDNADGSDSHTKAVTVTSSPQWVDVTADFSGSSTFSGNLGLYMNRISTNRSVTAGSTVTIKHIHIYRSDLGGMAQVPGAATGFEYYVPTNGNAEYLPRVGHHVYNGSTWVNEGLLIESEPRTNLVANSQLGGAVVGVVGSGGALPTGWASVAFNTVEVMEIDTFQGVPRIRIKATCDNSGNGGPIYPRIEIGSYSPSASTTYNYSAWVMDGPARSSISTELLVPDGVVNFLNVDCSGATEMTQFSKSATTAAGATGTHTIRVAHAVLAGDVGVSDFYISMPQFEQGEAIPNTNPVQYKDAPTPSSYMPTSGGTYTRTAQSLEVPPAEFGWPEPEFIGPELVDNGGFDGNDSSGWTDISGVWNVTGDALSGSSVPANAYGPYVNNSDVVAGRVYRATFTLSVTTGSLHIRVGNTQTAAYSSSGEYSVELVAYTTGVTSFQVRAGSEFTGTIDNISVREINPLSVSIQMDGRMTYADTASFNEVEFYRHRTSNGQERINAEMSTFGTYTGRLLFNSTQGGSNETSQGDAYSPGVLVPFNIASRHGSTFVNGGVDGVALTADTTPTALPDLSGTNLQIAYDFMGTIGTFRQFAGDIGDTGLVTATNPSTEPTLSLTFDGTDGSFYNLSWSE